MVQGKILLACRRPWLCARLPVGSELARFRYFDLVLDRAQKAFVRRTRFAGNRIGHLAMIERCFDFVEVFVEQLLRLVLERCEQRAMHVFLHPAVVEILTRDDEIIDPQLLRLRIHTRIGFDRVFQREQYFHARQTLLVRARNRVRNRIDDEARAHAGKTFLRRFRAQPRHFIFGEALDAFARVEAQLLRQIQAFSLGFHQACKHGKYRGEAQRMRIQMDVAERGCGRHELRVDPRFLI